ncbi:DinB family protein [Flavisolibacter sp. BT320]|nr:DinB family protein [Flavisolibacter longurius]
MSKATLPEVWLRGPIPRISPYLQPAVHALLQAKEEINALMASFPDSLLWEKPADMASAAFHLQHIPGVLDRLLTYAKGGQLSEEQFAYLKTEGVPGVETTQELLQVFNQKLDAFVEELKSLDEKMLTEGREVGRAKLPSTVLGLLFHAAEHTMRHNGQLLVTVNILQEKNQQKI